MAQVASVETSKNATLTAEEVSDNEAEIKEKHSLRSELTNVRDIEFLGDIYLGSPSSQLAKVVFDTGSDWLTIKSCLTEAHCHMKKLAPEALAQSQTAKMADTVYYMNQTLTGQAVNNIGFPLSYGSANLEGFKFQDYVCLTPINANSLIQVSKKFYDDHFCVKDLLF